MAETLNVSVRSQSGTRASRRTRREGRIPAVLYGHGRENVNLSIVAEEVAAAIGHGGKMVDLRGDVHEAALIRAVQWDAFGLDVLHLDLTRVSAGETVEVSVAVDLRGEAPGAKLGGVLDHVLYEVQIKCPAAAIPDKFDLNVNSLQLGGTLTVGDLELPAGASLITGADEIVVHCVEPAAEEEAAPEEGIEPEVIGRKAGLEEGAEEQGG